jgi:23S rRNA (adenine2503-C2)-methyltransferase
MISPLRTVDDLRRALQALDARPVHVRRVLASWLDGRAGAEIPRLRGRTPRRPVRLEAGLAALMDELDRLVTEVHAETDEDGSCRRLLRLRSGRTIEAVDLPQDALCVSTQVGCAVGCRFCRTGEDGLLQQLDALEILAQLAHARRTRPVRRVVLMGMGEPAHNLDAVLDAIATMGDEGGVAHKSIVFSTVGDPRDLEVLARQRVKPSLALSLHTLDADLRAELLPRAPRIEPTILLDAAIDYADLVHEPLLVQWTLLDGINDSVEEAARVGQFLRGRRAIVNYIPFNAVEGSGFRRPAVERCVQLVRAVRAAGALATLRFSAGQDVEGGCGQLRARLAEQLPEALGGGGEVVDDDVRA